MILFKQYTVDIQEDIEVYFNFIMILFKPKNTTSQSPVPSYFNFIMILFKLGWCLLLLHHTLAISISLWSYLNPRVYCPYSQCNCISISLWSYLNILLLKHSHDRLVYFNFIMILFKLPRLLSTLQVLLYFNFIMILFKLSEHNTSHSLQPHFNFIMILFKLSN